MLEYSRVLGGLWSTVLGIVSIVAYDAGLGRMFK